MTSEGRAVGATRTTPQGNHLQAEHLHSDHDAINRAEAERVVRATGLNQGMQVLSYLIAGVLCYGFFGWLGDRMLGTGFLLPIGIVVGAGLGAYVIIRRFGALEKQTMTAGTKRTTTNKTKGIT